MLNHKEAAKLIRVANGMLRRDTLKSLLPSPMYLSVCAHDTGCQPSIDARGDGLATVLIWQGSVWYASCYEVNDRDKILGIQPGCEWAEPIIEKFFTELQQLMAKHQADEGITQAIRHVTEDRRRIESIAVYRRILGA